MAPRAGIVAKNRSPAASGEPGPAAGATHVHMGLSDSDISYVRELISDADALRDSPA